ncbi:MAG: hypothetical protein R3C61_19130 [Bacteroidia bacterium]
MKKYVPKPKSAQSKVRIAKVRSKDNLRKNQSDDRSPHLHDWMIREDWD